MREAALGAQAWQKCEDCGWHRCHARNVALACQHPDPLLPRTSALIKNPSRKAGMQGDLSLKGSSGSPTNCTLFSCSSLHLWRIVVGATDLSKLPDDVQIHTVSKVVLHQDYNPLTEENDIALIELDSPVTFSVKTSDVLQEAKLNILDTQKCNSSDWYNGAMSSHTFWGKGCGEANSPGIYTSVQQFLEWILGEMIEIDEGTASGEKHLLKHRQKGSVTLLPIKTAASQPLEYLEGNYIDSSKEPFLTANEDEDQQEEATWMALPRETEPTIALQEPFLPTGFLPPSLEPPYLPLERLVTLEPPFYPKEIPPTSLPLPYIPREIPPTSLKLPFIPPEVKISVEPPYIPEQKPYITPEPPVLPTQPKYTRAHLFLFAWTSSRRAAEPPYVHSQHPHSVEEPYIPRDPPYTPPDPPYTPPDLPGTSLVPPYSPLDPPYTPPRLRFIPPVATVPLERPYVPPETHHHIEQPYTPPEDLEPYVIGASLHPPAAPIHSSTAPFIPEEEIALLEQPYLPPAKPPYVKPPPGPPKHFLAPTWLPRKSVKREAPPEPLDIPPEKVGFPEPFYTHRRKTHSLEPPKMPPRDVPPQLLAGPPAGPHKQGVPRPLAPDLGKSMQIVGGINALPGTWPWLVSLQVPSAKGPQHLCAGSILDAHWVLTAAHCFKSGKRSLQSHRIVIGATDISNLLDTVQLRSIYRIVPYQEYNPQSEANDIALVELSSPVIFDNYVQPACLPHSTEARVKILETSKCNSSWWYNGAMSPYTLCARYEDGGIDTCQGDSGGPLMCKTSPTSPFYVVGITSWGKGCGEGTNPEVYTSTQPFLKWIHGEMVKTEGEFFQEKGPSNKAHTHATTFPAFKIAFTQLPKKSLKEDPIYFPETELPEVDAIP
ncbi:hypothetical protein E2320_004441 [Naja naja]|nr:hypothetical protein E2320_004441 [Naja naja]